MFTGRASFPGGDLGYNRSGDYLAGGAGSGMGTMAQGTARLGQGIGTLGSMSGAGGTWEPSILYLFFLIIGEMVVFHIVSRLLK